MIDKEKKREKKKREVMGARGWRWKNPKERGRRTSSRVRWEGGKEEQTNIE